VAHHGGHGDQDHLGGTTHSPASHIHPAQTTVSIPLPEPRLYVTIMGSNTLHGSCEERASFRARAYGKGVVPMQDRDDLDLLVPRRPPGLPRKEAASRPHARPARRAQFRRLDSSHCCTVHPRLKQKWILCVRFTRAALARRIKCTSVPSAGCGFRPKPPLIRRPAADRVATRHVAGPTHFISQPLGLRPHAWGQPVGRAGPLAAASRHGQAVPTSRRLSAARIAAHMPADAPGPRRNAGDRPLSAKSVEIDAPGSRIKREPEATKVMTCPESDG